MTTAPTRSELTARSVISSTAGVRIAGCAGVLWAVLSIARLPLTGEASLPARDAAPDQVVGFFEGLSFDATFVAGIGLVTIGWVLLPVFIAFVADLLDRIDRGLRWVGLVALAGAVVEVGVTVMYLAAYSTGVFWASHTSPGSDAYVLLHGLSGSLLLLDSILFALWLVPLGVAIITTRLFPTWLGWALLATTIGSMAAFFLTSEVLWNVFGGLPYLWVLAAGVLMLVRSERYSQP